MNETKPWLEKNEFEKKLTLPGSAVVLFAADWCGYCRRFISMLGNYSGDTKNLLLVNVDSGDGALWDIYHINLVPTLIVFKEGKEAYRRNARPGVGLQKEDLDAAIRAA